MAPHVNSTTAAHISRSRRSSRLRSESESSEYSSASASASSSSSSQSEKNTKTITRSDSASSAASTASLFSEVGSVSGGSTVTTAATLRGPVMKRSKRFRLTRPKVKRMYKPRKNATEKTLREEADSGNFLLSTLEWSHWKKAVQRKNPQTAKWEPRFDGHPGARHISPFTDTDTPAVYEVAVKVPEHDEKVPVLTSVKYQGLSTGSWEAGLLSKDKLRRQVDRVLRRGCKVYVRRAPFSVRDMPDIYRSSGVERKRASARSTQDAVSELRGLITRVCDYAWKDHYDIPTRTYSHRRLTVNGVKVSD